MSTPVTHTFVTVPISTARVLTLNSAPVQLVPGSPGYLLNVNAIYLKYIAGATPFTVLPDDVLVAFTGDGNAVTSLLVYPGDPFNATGFMDQAASQAGYLDAWFQGPFATEGPFAAPAASIVGAGLYLTQFNTPPNDYSQFPNGTDWTDGTGSLLVVVEYSYLLA